MHGPAKIDTPGQFGDEIEHACKKGHQVGTLPAPMNSSIRRCLDGVLRGRGCVEGCCGVVLVKNGADAAVGQYVWGQVRWRSPQMVMGMWASKGSVSCAGQSLQFLD